MTWMILDEAGRLDKNMIRNMEKLRWMEKKKDLTTARNLQSLTIKTVLGQPKTWMLGKCMQRVGAKNKEGPTLISVDFYDFKNWRHCLAQQYFGGPVYAAGTHLNLLRHTHNQRNDTARRWNKFIVIWYIQNRIGKSQNRQWFSILFSNCPQSSPEISLPPGGWLSVLSLDSCTSVLAQHSRIQHRIFRIFNSVFSSGLVGF